MAGSGPSTFVPLAHHRQSRGTPKHLAGILIRQGDDQAVITRRQVDRRESDPPKLEVTDRRIGHPNQGLEYGPTHLVQNADLDHRALVPASTPEENLGGLILDQCRPRGRQVPGRVFNRKRDLFALLPRDGPRGHGIGNNGGRSRGDGSSAEGTFNMLHDMK